MASLISDMQCRSKARDAPYLLTSQAQIREGQTDKRPLLCRGVLNRLG